MMRLKILGYFLLVAALSSCNKESELIQDDDIRSAFHTLDMRVSNSDTMDSRAATPAEIAVAIKDMVLFAIDKQSKEILDTSIMQKKGAGLYSSRIPTSITLTTTDFYAVANVGANRIDLSGIEGKTFDDLLNMPLGLAPGAGNIASISPLHYVLMNKRAATYNSATKSLSTITLSRLPARIYLNCDKLGHAVEKISFQNIAKQTTLSTIINERGNANDKDITDWEDTDPQIMPNEKNYYYLVYPSRKTASLVVTANGQGHSVNLGEMKPGSSYIIQLNYSDEISFDGITTDGVIKLKQNEERINTFKLANTANIRTVELTSSDETIFMVEAGTGADWYKFNILGLTPGEATLTAKCDNVTIRCQVIVTGASTVTINTATSTTVIGSYNPGESVTISAPFIALKKFRSWASNALMTTADLNRPSFTFTMPEQSVVFTANHDDAPYKITVPKPGQIANDRSGTMEPALILETEQDYVRYYALGDYVYVTIPNEDKLFLNWGSDDYVINQNFELIKGGGGFDKTPSWFRMPDTYTRNNVITVFLKPKPYWSSRATTKGHIIANFVDSPNLTPGEPTLPGRAPFGRAFTELEKNLIMRALNKIEAIFADAPRRPLKITFSVTGASNSTSGGGTEPELAPKTGAVPPYEDPKPKWLASDLGGVATGLNAVSTKFEAVWRDKKNITPNDAREDNRFVGDCDGYVTLSNGWISGPNMYQAVDPSGYNSNKHIWDFETVIMHEVSHIVCYHPLSANYNTTQYGLPAMDVLIAEKNKPEKRLIYSNMTLDGFTEIVLMSEGAKAYLGEYPPLSPKDFSHMNLSSGLGAYDYMGGWRDGKHRQFYNFELALFQDMGWNISPDAWQKPPTPTTPR